MNWGYTGKVELIGLVFGLDLGEFKKNNQGRLLCLSDEVNSELRGLEEAEVYV